MSSLTQFSMGGIKSIQRGVITISSGSTTNTATITSVDTTKTELRVLGVGINANDVTYLPYAVLTNATTITATRLASPTNVSYVSWELTERY